MLPEVRHVTHARLQKYATPSEDEHPVLMYFYSPVCGPCHRAVPIFHKHVAALEGTGLRCRAYDTMRKPTDLIEFTPSLHLYNKGKLVLDLTDTFRNMSTDEMVYTVRKALSWTGDAINPALVPLDADDAEKMWKELLSQQHKLRMQAIQDAREDRSQTA